MNNSNKIYHNPTKDVVCEVALVGEEYTIISGPNTVEYPKQGFLVPAKINAQPVNEMDEHLGAAISTIIFNDDGEPISVKIEFPAMPLPEAERLAKYKLDAVKKLTSARKTKEVAGVTFGSHLVLTTREQQTELTSRLKRIMSGEELSEDNKYPILTEGGYVMFTLEDFKEAITKILEHVQNCFSEQRTKEGLVEAATTVEEVKAILA